MHLTYMHIHTYVLICTYIGHVHTRISALAEALARATRREATVELGSMASMACAFHVGSKTSKTRHYYSHCPSK